MISYETDLRALARRSVGRVALANIALATTELGYGTTNVDAAVGIGTKRGDSQN